MCDMMSQAAMTAHNIISSHLIRLKTCDKSDHVISIYGNLTRQQPTGWLLTCQIRSRDFHIW
jgi:hypothetical protein